MPAQILGFTQTSEIQAGNVVVPVREYRCVSMPSDTPFGFRRPKGKWSAANIKSVAGQFSDRIEAVFNLPDVTDVSYSQDVTPSGKLVDMMTTFYSADDGAIQGSVESTLAQFGPNFTGAQVAAEIAAGGDFLG